MPAEYVPTAEQRALVQNAAAFGINQADIANQLNIDEKTTADQRAIVESASAFGITQAESVAVPALLGCTMDAEAACARASDLLARVGLGNRADAYPGSMSGGEQRRVGIARALINSPPLLLADEPTGDLDEDTEADIIDLLEQLHGSETFSFVLVSHNWISPNMRSASTRCGKACSR
jgi:predicted ABC-type transport system involved in lysophospholipase L1 biosynthesis ATPase subunit